MFVLPTTVRIAHECPFEDVRNVLQGYLKHVQDDLHIHVPQPAPASAFIAVEKLVSKTSPGE